MQPTKYAKRSLTSSVVIVGGGPVGLILSRLLNEYDVPHCIVEKRTSVTSHPQAHYLNIRTNEILRFSWPAAHLDVVKQSPSSLCWR
jgi:flavin-dependent dehydrogenase